MWITAYDPFDAQTDGYATMEVTYVMGPFAELTSDGKDHIRRPKARKTPPNTKKIISAAVFFPQTFNKSFLNSSIFFFLPCIFLNKIYHGIRGRIMQQI